MALVFLKNVFSQGIVLVLLCQGIVQGQSIDSTKRVGRWYVGGGAAVHRYFTLNAPYYQLKPAYLICGYIIRPRLAVQAEAQYQRQAKESDGGTSVINGVVYNFRKTSYNTSAALTLLARFSRSRFQRHLQFDWLLGVALVRGSVSGIITRTSATRSESYTLPTQTVTEPHLVGGISLRYLIGPRVAITTELLLSKNMRIAPFSYGIIPGTGASLGVTYLLGKDKP